MIPDEQGPHAVGGRAFMVRLSFQLNDAFEFRLPASDLIIFF